MASRKSVNSPPAEAESRRPARSWLPLAGILLAACLHGLLYVFLLPPWQHYDEPNHFEYAWLIANRLELPQVGDYDQEMRRQTAASMIEHQFFRNLGFLPDLDATDQPIWIGQYSQLGDPPLYYLLAAAPLLLPVHDITQQLYLARLVSFALFLLSVYAAWGMMGEITAPGNSLRWAVPLTLALLPSYADVMTGVNNLSAAVAFFAICLWGCVRLVSRGFTWRDFAWAAGAALLCWYTAPAAYLAAPLLTLALLFSLLRWRWRWMAWVILGAFLLGLGFLTVETGDPLRWYRSSLQDDPLRVKHSQAVVGEYAFQVDLQGQVSPDWAAPLFQSIGAQLSPGVYTFGGWMWSTRPLWALTPTVGVGAEQAYNTVEVGTDPAFYSLRLEVVGETRRRAYVSLAPKADRSQPGELYYDGLVLAEGEFPLDQPPVFADASAQVGTWGGKPFVNLIRNGSAEQAGLRVHPIVDRIGGRLLPDNLLPSLLLTYLTDWEGSDWHFRLVGRNLFRSFWGLFGWGHVPFAASATYDILLWVTIAGLAGFVIWLVLWMASRAAQGGVGALPWELTFLLGVTLLLAWGSTLARGAIYLSQPRLYVPVARYAFPAIAPLVAILAGGWLAWLNWALAGFRRWVSRPQQWMLGVYLAGLLLLDGYAVWSILRYYGG